MTDIDAIDRDIQTASDGIEGPDAPYNHAALCAMSAARLLRAEVDRLRSALAGAETTREFGRLAVKERDYERERADRLIGEARKARAEVDRLRDGIEQVAVELDRSDDTADQADALRALLEHKQCPSCAPGYDCERGIYTKAVAR